MTISLNGSGGITYPDGTVNTTRSVSTAGDTINGALIVNGNLSFNSGYGSAAVAYGCRAWVNFNGTGTVAIRASGNVSSITDNSVGNYTVNFATALLDQNFIAVVSGVTTANSNLTARPYPFGSYGSASFRMRAADPGNNVVADADSCHVAIFR